MLSLSSQPFRKCIRNTASSGLTWQEYDIMSRDVQHFHTFLTVQLSNTSSVALKTSVSRVILRLLTDGIWAHRAASKQKLAYRNPWDLSTDKNVKKRHLLSKIMSKNFFFVCSVPICKCKLPCVKYIVIWNKYVYETY